MIPYNFKELVLERQIRLINKQPDGLLKDLLTYHYQRPGKMIRSDLVTRIVPALNIDSSRIIDWCAACEMLHNATLIHDDLQDGDESRRGQTSVWKKFGANQAINGGDFLLAAAPSVILDSDLSALEQITLSKIYSELSTELVRGQSIEFTLKDQISEPSLKSAYEECISLKTGKLFSGLMEGLAVIGKINKANTKDLMAAFNQIGIIFQIQDDILDLYGDKKRSEIGCDVKEGKISCLVTQYLKLYPKDQFKILPIILNNRNLTTDQETLLTINTFKDSGVLSACLQDLEEKINFVNEIFFIANNKELNNVIKEIIYLITEPIKHLRQTNEPKVETSR